MRTFNRRKINELSIKGMYINTTSFMCGFSILSALRATFITRLLTLRVSKTKRNKKWNELKVT